MAEGFPHDAWHSTVWCAKVSQAVLELVVEVVEAEAAEAAHLFSLCNVAWRSFSQTRG
jgi:hypothetical protein